MDIQLPKNLGNIQAYNGRFLPGRSGNPAGKPKGALNKTTRVAVELLEGEAEGITRKCVEMALAGDIVAIKLCLDRLIPPRREMPEPTSKRIETDMAEEVRKIFQIANRAVGNR